MATHEAELAHPAAASAARPGGTVSLFHLYALRIVFFLMAVFLLSTSGPQLLNPNPSWTSMSVVARALLVALGLLAAVGVRYPLQMLPLMIFELAWKALWLAFIGLPLWAEGRLDADNMENFKNILPGVIVLPVILPWRYMWENYVKRPADRWR
jgi:hypothetical protein